MYDSTEDKQEKKTYAQQGNGQTHTVTAPYKKLQILLVRNL